VSCRPVPRAAALARVRDRGTANRTAAHLLTTLALVEGVRDPVGMVEPIVHRRGEDEALFGGRIVLKSALPELTITESVFPDARPGAAPHRHREHADAFYVLEGRLGFLVDAEEHELGPGGFVYAPPGVVHGFRSLSPARFLNVHTPDGGFAAALRERDRGGPGVFDSVDAEPGSGLPATEAILLDAGAGEALRANHRVATVKVGSDHLSLIELSLEPGFGGPTPHAHDDHTDCFYVLDGTAVLLVDGRRVVAEAGTFVAAPPGVEHTFTSGPAGARVLNIHAPGVGFADRLREMSVAAAPR
jgi:quercetin dioxygenase-like cupin family protein